MKTRQQMVQQWLHERICVPDDECGGPDHHAEQAAEVMRLAIDSKRDRLLVTLAGAAQKYVTTKGSWAYGDLFRAVGNWSAYDGDPS